MTIDYGMNRGVAQGDRNPANLTGLFYQRDDYPPSAVFHPSPEVRAKRIEEWQGYIESEQLLNFQQRLFLALRDGRRYTSWYTTIKNVPVVHTFGYIVLADLEAANTTGEYVDADRLPGLKLGATWRVTTPKRIKPAFFEPNRAIEAEQLIVRTYRKVELGGPYLVLGLKLIEITGLGKYDIELEEAPASSPAKDDIELG